MSYDVWVQDLPPGIHSIEDIPDDFRPGPLGSRPDLIRRIVEAAPSAEFTDPAWGVIDGPDYSVEIGLGGDPVECCHFILRGGEAAVGVVCAIVGHLGLPALHSGGDGLLRPEEALAGFLQWSGYRERIVSDAGPAAA